MRRADRAWMGGLIAGVTLTLICAMSGSPRGEPGALAAGSPPRPGKAAVVALLGGHLSREATQPRWPWQREPLKALPFETLAVALRA